MDGDLMCFKLRAPCTTLAELCGGPSCWWSPTGYPSTINSRDSCCPRVQYKIPA